MKQLILVEFYTVNVGLVAIVEFECDHDCSLPLPSICGCDYVYRHIILILLTAYGYRGMLFNCEYLLIANWKHYLRSQLIDSQT